MYLGYPCLRIESHHCQNLKRAKKKLYKFTFTGAEFVKF